MKKYLLCTDLDRTLIPNGAQPESPDARALFRCLAAREEVTLAYVSGRHRALIEQAITDYGLPRPDYAIADVGSTIYQVNGDNWQPWNDWDDCIAPDWAGLAHDDLYALLNVFTALRPQEMEKQGRHKLSFYAPPETDAPTLLDEMDRRLKQAGIRANLIWSVDETRKLGLLDVLPSGANKLHAIRFLMAKQGFGLEHTMFAGDSGNDLDVLLSDIPAVLVANARADVKARAAQAAPPTLYVSRGGYLGMNGNYSAGIIEGAAYHWPEIEAWLPAKN
ncbi:MAG: HAD-IIB family hydrolase [Gallionella sp.]|nr:HAD-IIB family hydrolase [Gallionella sp.]